MSRRKHLPMPNVAVSYQRRQIVAARITVGLPTILKFEAPSNGILYVKHPHNQQLDSDTQSAGGHWMEHHAWMHSAIGSGGGRWRWVGRRAGAQRGISGALEAYYMLLKGAATTCCQEGLQLHVARRGCDYMLLGGAAARRGCNYMLPGGAAARRAAGARRATDWAVTGWGQSADWGSCPEWQLDTRRNGLATWRTRSLAVTTEPLAPVSTQLSGRPRCIRCSTTNSHQLTAA